MKIIYVLSSVFFNTLFWIITPLWLIFILWPLSYLKSPTPMRQSIGLWLRLMITLMHHLSGIRIEERGIENVPRNQGFILCSKHMSNLEALILYRQCPGLTALGKIELFRMFALSQVLTKMDVMPIDRKKSNSRKKTRKMAKMIFDQKRPLLLFPEGTRIPVGTRKPLKSGVYYFQKELNLPVICVSTNTGCHWLKGKPFNWPGTVIVQYHPALPENLDKEDFMKLVWEKVVIDSENLMEPDSQK